MEDAPLGETGVEKGAHGSSERLNRPPLKVSKKGGGGSSRVHNNKTCNISRLRKTGGGTPSGGESNGTMRATGEQKNNERSVCGEKENWGGGQNSGSVVGGGSSSFLGNKKECGEGGG